MCAAACTHRRLHPPINDTNAAALTTSGSTARQAALEGSGVLGVPPLAMLMLAGSLDHCQTGSSSTLKFSSSREGPEFHREFEPNFEVSSKWQNWKSNFLKVKTEI
jgi:hypothetical protein